MFDIVDELKKLRYEIWLRDIPSPTVPEYQEHHRDIQQILSMIDNLIARTERQIKITLGMIKEE